jgi:hypothetical protein
MTRKASASALASVSSRSSVGRDPRQVTQPAAVVLFLKFDSQRLLGYD